MSIADTTIYQERIKSISQKFIDDMMSLHVEEPEMFEGRATLEQWANQVWSAKLDLEKRIEEQVEEVEELLHGGSYTHQFKI
tara:strand:+ start:1181 stop:1426 length:246 start_codon:yes stop_codon:yes gene_type:complete